MPTANPPRKQPHPGMSSGVVGDPSSAVGWPASLGLASSRTACASLRVAARGASPSSCRSAAAVPVHESLRGIVLEVGVLTVGVGARWACRTRFSSARPDGRPCARAVAVIVPGVAAARTAFIPIHAAAGEHEPSTIETQRVVVGHADRRDLAVLGQHLRATGNYRLAAQRPTDSERAVADLAVMLERQRRLEPTRRRWTSSGIESRAAPIVDVERAGSVPTGNEAVRCGSIGPAQSDCWTRRVPSIAARAGAATINQHASANNSASGSFGVDAPEAEARISDPYQSASNAATKWPC
jgi:hypothetical protein